MPYKNKAPKKYVLFNALTIKIIAADTSLENTLIKFNQGRCQYYSMDLKDH